MPVWINEFHYDNSTTNDPGEFIEIAGTAGTDLTGWTIVLYNGGGTVVGQSYSIRNLTGTIADQGNGFGTVFLSYANTVQNGSPDGIALVDSTGTVVQFLSYEGVMTASNGPAAGMTSTDVGVGETNSTAPGSSLGLVGTGDDYSDFTWAVLTNDTPGGANVGQTFQGTGPVVPVLSIGDVSASEGNSGTVTYTFTVSLDAPAPAGGVTFDIATADGTSTTANGDYVARALTGQTIPEGSTSYTFDVTVNGDASLEPNEDFFVNVTNVTGATVSDGQGMGTITNDDLPPVPQASVGDATLVEGDGGVTYLVFTVSLSFAPTGAVSLDYSTADGTALASSDYLAVSGSLNFAAGETSRTISVPIIGDERPELGETFGVTLSNPSGATIADGAATGTITNDDGPSYFSLASGNLTQDWTDTSQIASDDNWSGVPFIIGYRGDGLTDSTGADPRTITGTSSVVDVVANQTNPNTNTSGGVVEFELANPVVALQGSGTADAPHLVLYVDSRGREGVTVSYNLRDVDGSADNSVQQVALQYRLGDSGPWIDVPSAYVADATSGPSQTTQVTAVTATLPADANNQAAVQVRIITTNAAGSDEWVGVDDIVVSSQAALPSLSIDDSAAFEGTGGTTPISFTVTRTGDTSAAATADYAVSFAGGSFSASPADLEAGDPLTGTVTFAAGETSRTITLDIAADSDPEADEAFTVTLSNVAGATISDAAATGTIVNDDGAPPFVTIADVTASEGNSGTTTFTFTVTRSGGTGAFTVDYSTVDGSATAGSDYEGTSGTLSFAAGENSKTVEVTVSGDVAPELAETFSVQLSNPTGFAVIADSSATGTVQNDDIFFINQIQGNSYYSPILAAEGLINFNVASGTTVLVQAVVTAIDADGPRQGFYITEETDNWDSDLNSSEGIFVMTRNDAGVGVDVATAIAGLAVGDLVTVSASVIEYQAFQSMPRTMLTNPTSILIESSGNALPTLVLDGSRPIPNSIMTLVTPDYTDSVDDAGDSFEGSLYALSFWETVEGMLVTLPDMVVADGFVSRSGGQPIFQSYSQVHADADQINGRGGYTVAGDPPNSPPDTAETEDDTIAGGNHLHDGDINPDIIELDFSGFAIDAPAGLAEQATMGDFLGDVTGIVDFDFTDRKLFVTDYTGTEFVNGVPTQETTALGSDPRSLTVATFNVENLDPGDGQARFDAIAQAIANNLNSPDIIMIEEIQDNDGTGTGTTDASMTWQMLVDALNAAVPGAAYQWVDEAPVNNAEGGQPNGNIRVGFLYDTNRVQLGDLPADATIEQRRQYTDRIGDGVRDAGDLIAFSDDMLGSEINTADWSSTRRSLLGEFTFNGNTIYLTANHFTAKGGSGEIWQIGQDLTAGEPENAGWERRIAQSNDLYAMLNLIEGNAPNAGVITGGDFNDFYFYRPLEVATGYVRTDGTPRTDGARFDNLTLTLPEAERYTYTFDGRSQALDHILTSQFLSAVATYDVVHLNTGFNGFGTGADADLSISDHDPAVASFNFSARAEVLNGTAGNDSFDGMGGNDRIGGKDGDDSIEGGDGDDALFGDAGNDRIGGGNDNDYLAGGLGNDGLFGGAGNDFIAGDEGDDYVDGGAGNDQMHGGTGDDRILGKDGDDYIDGDGGADVLFGDAGNDRIRGGNMNDYIAGGIGSDALYGDEGDDFIRGGEGDDYIDGGIGSDAMYGDGGNDRIAGKDGDDYIDGGEGADGLFGDAGNDRIRGGGGDDYVTGGIGNDAVYGDAGNDFLVGADGDDYLDGAAGNDAIHGGAGIDTIVGGAGDDYIDAGVGNDSVVAQDGNDTLIGGIGDDILDGGAGNDLINGGEGNDNLRGGAGADVMAGQGGADVYRYLSTSDSVSGSADTIKGFEHLVDRIDLAGIDSNSFLDGNQVFKFIDDDAFTGNGAGSAGQLRAFNVSGNVWQVEGDVNGDGVADLVIRVQMSDSSPLTPGDFIL